MRCMNLNRHFHNKSCVWGKYLPASVFVLHPKYLPDWWPPYSQSDFCSLLDVCSIYEAFSDVQFPRNVLISTILVLVVIEFTRCLWSQLSAFSCYSRPSSGCHWPALCAGLLCCNFFGQPGSVSKFPPLLWVKLWVGWVGRGYTEISRYFPASWINWVTLVTKIKLLYSLRF